MFQEFQVQGMNEYTVHQIHSYLINMIPGFISSEKMLKPRLLDTTYYINV